MKIFSRIFFYIFLIFAKNIVCGYMLEPPHRDEAVLMSTHNLWFVAKIRKRGIALQTPVFLYKRFRGGGVYVIVKSMEERSIRKL